MLLLDGPRAIVHELDHSMQEWAGARQNRSDKLQLANQGLELRDWNARDGGGLR
jgi:hypothetical protein